MQEWNSVIQEALRRRMHDLCTRRAFARLSRFIPVSGLVDRNMADPGSCPDVANSGRSFLEYFLRMDRKQSYGDWHSKLARRRGTEVGCIRDSGSRPSDSFCAAGFCYCLGNYRLVRHARLDSSGSRS